MLQAPSTHADCLCRQIFLRTSTLYEKMSLKSRMRHRKAFVSSLEHLAQVTYYYANGPQSLYNSIKSACQLKFSCKAPSGGGKAA